MSSRKRPPAWVPLALAVIVMLVLLALGWRYLSRRALVSEIPALPEFGRSTPAVVRQLTEADTQARRHGGSGDALGHLGMVYHANAFYEHARIAYRLAMRVDPKEPRWPYYLGVLEVTTGENERAIAFLTQAVELDAHNSHAWARLGQLYFRKEMWDEAEQAYREALNLDPTHPHACVGMARVLGQRDRWADAIGLLEGAVRAHPNFGPAHRVLAMAYGNVGRTADMKRHEERGSEIGLQMLDPLMYALIDISSTASVLVTHGQISQNWGDFERAERLFRRAVAVAPEDADARLALGRILALPALANRQRLEQARAQFEVGLELDPSYVNTRHHYATVLLALADSAGAEAQWERILQEEPQHAMALMSLGQISFYRHEYARAREFYRRGLSIPPDTPFSLGEPAMGHHRLAHACLRMGRTTEALDEFRRAIETDPRLSEPYIDQAKLLADTGDVEEGIAVYEAGISRNPDDAHLRLGLGNYLLQSGRYPEARAALENARKLAPSDPRVLSAIGYVELQMGNTDAAIGALEAALQVYPDFILAHYHLGNALMEKGLHEEAIQHFERALQIQPSFRPAREALSRVRGR